MTVSYEAKNILTIWPTPRNLLKRNQDICPQKHTYKMFIAELSMIAKNWTQSKCL